ncbi:MAG: hypothetical protein ABJA75_20225 [Bradyrhizobium sp.]
MDNWAGFGYFVVGIVVVLFLLFLVSLFGHEPCWKLLSLGFCIATALLPSDLLMALFWFGAWICAGLAIRARLKAKAADAADGAN